MNIQEIIDAICDALFAAFGATHKIYTEQVEQGFEAPCFFVKCVDPAQRLMITSMYQRTHTFSVQFFPAVEGSYNECQTATEKLFDCLEDLEVVQTVGTTTVTRILHGLDMHASVTDEVLTFLVDYNLFLLNQGTLEDDMAEIDYDLGLK